MKHKYLLLTISTLAVLLLAFFAYTNPFTVSPELYAVPFVLIFSIVFLASNRIIALLARNSTNRQVRIAASACSIFVVLLVALLSIGEVTGREIVVMVVLFIGCILYALKVDIFR